MSSTDAAFACALMQLKFQFSVWQSEVLSLKISNYSDFDADSTHHNSARLLLADSAILNL